MGLFSHGLAVLGGKGAGIIRLGELVGRDEVLVELLLEGGESIGDVGLGLGLQGLAGDLVGVGDVTAETLKREVAELLHIPRRRVGDQVVARGVLHAPLAAVVDGEHPPVGHKIALVALHVKVVERGHHARKDLIGGHRAVAGLVSKLPDRAAVALRQQNSALMLQ